MLCYGVQMLFCFNKERTGPEHHKCGKHASTNRYRAGHGWDEGILKNSHCVYSVEEPVILFLPFPALETSSWTVELSVFFFFVTAVPFLSNVIGLYCGRLLNFLSNSSSSFPRLTSEVQNRYAPILSLMWLWQNNGANQCKQYLNHAIY